MPRHRCSIAKTSAAHDRFVQKIALTAIVDQARQVARLLCGYAWGPTIPAIGSPFIVIY
jgi:hypothetical protein